MSEAANTATGWKQRLRRELFQYWLTVLYLSLYFGTFVWYRRLILAQHQISYLNYGVALIEALVLAKVILIGDLLRLGHGLENRPLVVPTFFRSAMFTLWVAVFTVAEHMIKGLLRGEGVIAGLKDFVGKGTYELLASSLVVFFTFIPFFGVKELNRVLGRGKIWGLFFRSPVGAQAARTSSSAGH